MIKIMDTKRIISWVLGDIGLLIGRIGYEWMGFVRLLDHDTNLFRYVVVLFTCSYKVNDTSQSIHLQCNRLAGLSDHKYHIQDEK